MDLLVCLFLGWQWLRRCLSCEIECVLIASCASLFFFLVDRLVTWLVGYCWKIQVVPGERAHVFLGLVAFCIASFLVFFSRERLRLFGWRLLLSEKSGVRFDAETKKNVHFVVLGSTHLGYIIYSRNGFVQLMSTNVINVVVTAVESMSLSAVAVVNKMLASLPSTWCRTR